MAEINQDQDIRILLNTIMKRLQEMEPKQAQICVFVLFTGQSAAGEMATRQIATSHFLNRRFYRHICKILFNAKVRFIWLPSEILFGGSRPTQRE